MANFEAFSRHNPPHDPGITFDDPSLTQQHFQPECDINTILSRYSQTGVLAERQGSFYADFSSGMDFRETLDFLRSTQEDFLSLPASTRARFNNDPALLIDFVNDPANHPKFAEYGLAPSGNSAPLDITVTTDTNLIKKDDEK
nr:MAG: internal scaffolding protein [Microvirus sp.]